MLNTLFVVDSDSVLVDSSLNVITFASYLQDYPKLNEPKIRIINLCDTSRYLSQGYYCSLLAAARGHQVIPNVKTINAMRKGQGTLWFEYTSLGKQANHLKNRDSFLICMGETNNPDFKKLAQRIFQKYTSPILQVSVNPESTGIHTQVIRVSLSQLSHDQYDFCLNTLEQYAQKSWRSKNEQKKYRWEMAILVDPNEKMPPSNKGAISRFIRAGEKLGIRARAVTVNELNPLSQYDALFIRETTAIDHHTYRLAIEAENLGLVVMDDPSSILRCCNKVYLHDAFSYKKVPGIYSQVFTDSSDASLDYLEQCFEYPLVLKMPEGSFSKGVFKVSSRQELKDVADKLLQDSALVLAQRYMYTEFDWRIGVLNGRALYACRYYMAKNHWQIYNHSSKRFSSGDFDTLPTFEVPSRVLNAAMKAAAVIGNGLYGIDLKEDNNGNAYVLEVNDNPSLEHGVEDAYLGDELYMQVMGEFLRRLEQRGK